MNKTDFQGVTLLEGRLLVPYVVLQTFPEGLLPENVEVNFLDSAFQLPVELTKYKERVMGRMQLEAEKAGRVLFEGKLVRLVDYFPNDDKGSLKLIVQQTTFFTHTASNKALEDKIDELGGQSPLQFYGLTPKELDSVLANPIGVSSVLVTRDNHVIITERSNKLSQYPGLYGLPAGFMNPDDRTVHATAYREIREEVGNFGAEVRLVELGRALDDLHVEITMVGKIDGTKSGIEGAITMSEWESRGKYFVPFNPRDCANYLVTTISSVPSNVPPGNWILGKSPKWVPVHHRALYLALTKEYGQEAVNKELNSAFLSR
ncbi:NUDIX domain-containing protein [Candidatus Woesearchaeota archaeon]|nr:NUDIX domain-containing protein [Candidatus Woesearchaeota archaeon]